MQTPKRKRYQKDTAPADDIITLIHLVRQNPALYNYKLQPNQRRRIDVLTGWANIAAQIGEKYTVEECRRKWKNLRDTYHQYRLRKPKLGDGLSKWRYAKELEFLSNVYQPKLKSHRQSHGYDSSSHSHSHHGSHLHACGGVDVTGVVHATTSHIHDDTNGIVHHSSNSITLVNDDETFILTAYEESVNDDVTTIDHHGTHHEDHHHSMSHMELSTHDNDVEDVEMVKNEQASSLDDDDDGATGAEVDYEEVCMYEEATGNVDCETTIIGGGNVGGGTDGVVRSTSTDSSKGVFQYIDANDFCIESVTSHTHFTNHSGGGGGASGSGGGGGNNSNSSVGSAVVMSAAKLKNVTMAANTTTLPISSINSNVVGTPTSLATSVMQLQSAPITYTQQPTARDELDLFFDFLKKKMQRFPKEEITSIQVEFLNCVLRREAESANAQKSISNLQQ